MSGKGYIKLHRQIQDCWIWDTGKFDKRSAWIDLLMLANHKDKKIVFNGSYINIKKGQYLTSIRNLAKRWGWSVSTVSEFLTLLEEDLMIKKESDRHRTLLTVVNYEVFQEVPNTDQTVTDTPASTPAETNNTLNKLNIQRKEVSKDTSKRKFVPPTIDEVSAYCQERNNFVDPERFIDFYESKGWMVGSNKMKDWKAAVRTWEKKDKDKGYSNKPVQNHDISTDKIFDLKEQDHAPYFGFPAEWFSNGNLDAQKVKPVIRPINTKRGWYREEEIDVTELLDIYAARKRYANEH